MLWVCDHYKYFNSLVFIRKDVTVFLRKDVTVFIRKDGLVIRLKTIHALKGLTLVRLGPHINYFKQVSN